MPPLSPTALMLLIYGACCLVPSIFLSTLLHEIGHAACGKRGGYRVTALGLGSADPYLIKRFAGGLLLYLCRREPLGGMTLVYHPGLFPTATQEALLAVGGAAGNLLGVLVGGSLVILYRSSPASSLPLAAVGLSLFLWNAVVLLTNLVPFRARFAGVRQRSDGALLLTLLLRSRFFGAPLISRVIPPAELLRLRPLLEQTGNTAMLRSLCRDAAGASLDIGDIAAARRYLNEAEALDISGPPHPPEAATLLARGRLLDQEGDRTGAELLYSAAEKAFATAGHHRAYYYTQIGRRDADTPGRLRLLRQKGEIMRDPILYLHLCVAELEIAVDQEQEKIGEPAMMEALISHYEAARRRYRSALWDSVAYDTIGELRTRQNSHHEAAQASLRSLAATRTVYAELQADATAQAAYLQRTRPRIAICLQRLRAVGLSAEAEEAETVLLH